MSIGTIIILAAVAPLVGGLILSAVLKLLFNKITGKNERESSSFGEFVGAWIATSGALYGILFIIWMGTCINNCTG